MAEYSGTRLYLGNLHKDGLSLFSLFLLIRLLFFAAAATALAIAMR